MDDFQSIDGHFLQKVILELPTPYLRAKQSDSGQNPTKLVYECIIIGIWSVFSIGSCSFVPIVCVSINTHPRHVLKRLGMRSSLLA